MCFRVLMVAMARLGLSHSSLILAAVLAAAACGSEEQPEAPSPSSTVTRAPTASPTQSPLPPSAPVGLAEALASGETLANVPMSRPELLYAVKEGHHVTVFRRRVATGDEQAILEYDEAHEAKHSQNYWEEQPPSLTLNESGDTLVYIEEDGVAVYEASTGASRTALHREPGPTFGSSGLTRSRWIGDGGAELCFAFNVAEPVISPDGQRVAVTMTQYEGSSLAVFDATGAAACLIEGATSGNPAWGAQGDLLIPGGGGEYARAGLFVVPRSDPCAAVKIAEAPAQYLAGFESGSWSADGSTIITSLVEGEPEPVHASLRLVSRDGSENRVLIADGFNFWPTFDPTQRHIYFVRRSRMPRAAEESIGRYDLESGDETIIQNVPGGWSLRSPSWTADGQLVFRAHSNKDGCYYWSCDDRVVVLDPASGNVVYASAPRDFTNYLGFLP